MRAPLPPPPSPSCPPPFRPFLVRLVQFGDRISYTKRITVCFAAMGVCLVMLLVSSRIDQYALLGA